MALNLAKAYTPSSGQVANSSSYNTDIAALFNAFSGLEAQTSTLGALVVTPSANGATRFKVTDVAANVVFGVTTNDTATSNAVLVGATYKLYLDGGSDTYLFESAADILDIYVGAANVIKITEAASDKVEINGADLEIDAIQKFYLDGGGDTYLVESAADRLDFVVGGVVFLQMSESTTDQFAVITEFSIEATKKLYLDGGSNTYISETSADVISVNAGGTLSMQATATHVYAPIGIRVGGDAANNLIDDASGGTGSTTLYIGNASINVTSDKRLKKDIVDTSINAVEMIDKFRVRDFAWNDPSDKSINNRNSRGIWTGLIAQEAVDVCPFIVNAPRPDGKSIDHESDVKWTIEYQNLVPILIKAIQELSGRVLSLEAK